MDINSLLGQAEILGVNLEEFHTSLEQINDNIELIYGVIDSMNNEGVHSAQIVALESICGEPFSEYYPPQAFSTQPSQLNFTVATEGAAEKILSLLGKAIDAVFAMIGKVLGAVVKAILNALGIHINLDDKIQGANKLASENQTNIDKLSSSQKDALDQLMKTDMSIYAKYIDKRNVFFDAIAQNPDGIKKVIEDIFSKENSSSLREFEEKYQERLDLFVLAVTSPASYSSQQNFTKAAASIKDQHFAFDTSFVNTWFDAIGLKPTKKMFDDLDRNRRPISQFGSILSGMADDIKKWKEEKTDKSKEGSVDSETVKLAGIRPVVPDTDEDAAKFARDTIKDLEAKKVKIPEGTASGYAGMKAYQEQVSTMNRFFSMTIQIYAQAISLGTLFTREHAHVVAAYLDYHEKHSKAIQKVKKGDE